MADTAVAAEPAKGPDKNPKGRKVKLINRIGFGSGNLVGSGALALASAWLMIFLTSYCGLEQSQATVVTSFALLVDVIINPLAGFISDSFNNTKLGRKFGRRRFFILLAVPLLFLLNVLLWHVVEGAFWYYFAIYICYNIVYTFVMVPYNSLPAEMTTDFEERTYLGGLKAIFGKVANFLVNALPGVFFLIYGEKSETAFVVMGICFGVIMAASMLFVYLTTWERPVSEEVTEKVESIGEGMKKLFIDITSTFRLRTFRHLLGMYLFGFGAEWLYNSTFVYFVMYVLFLPKTQSSFWQSLSPIMQLISTIVVMGIVAKKGFRKPYMVAETVVIASVLCYVAIGFTGGFTVDNPATMATIALVTGIVVFFGLGTGAVYYIPWQAYIFVPDADEIVTGRRREDTYAAAMTLCGKLMNASVVAILGTTLALAGYVKGTDVVQPASVTSAVLWIMLIGVVGLSILGAYFAKRMQLDKETDQVLIAESERVLRQGGRMEDVDPEVKRTCERLTGVPYDICFGHNGFGYHTPEERAELKEWQAAHPEAGKTKAAK
ncbi:MAG: MFS transporter [Atopobiaceae bacterium]|nr:MFS transporter [Atopobiaceae bacterium]MCI1226041.1 MFS transporter [Atopobiaceae bacterium]MCI1259161.1 MFS transporter [Atopobiaceae bacterium]